MNLTPARLIAALTSAVALAAPLAAESRQETPQPAAAACVGIVLPSVEGAEGNATTVATAVRELFISYLTGPTIAAIPLEARLPSQAVLEARQKGCGHVVIPSVVRKRKDGNKFGSILGQAAGTAAWHMPYGGSAGAAAARAGAVTAAHTASMLAADTRAKDEIQLAYRLGTPDTVVQANSKAAKAKAKADGEDLLTPLVEKAAEEIASVAAPR
jgi:hypothetical protein